MTTMITSDLRAGDRSDTLTKETNMKMTFERLKIVNALKSGPKTWSVLRVAYYGEERAKHPASTSFHNQLQRMIEGGVVKKIPMGYTLTESYK